MKKKYILLLLSSTLCTAQSTQQKLDKAVKELLNSSAAYSAQLSVYVVDTQGKTIYQYQPNIGLSTASTQKIFTAACALETLGKDYYYTTTSAYNGTISNNILQGNLWFSSNGDPTLGSWRYENYKPDDFKNKLLIALKNKNISKIVGDIIIDDSYFDFQNTPGGWPWNDLGNYYGAGVWGFNWRENQFDLNMYGKEIRGTNVDLPEVKWVNDLKTFGNTDQSLIYTAPHSKVAYITGSLPDKSMVVSGAIPNPPLTFGTEIKKYLQENNIEFSGKIYSTSQMRIDAITKQIFPKENIFFTYNSPTLDKIVYWFLRKSVNLYGETIIKTLAKTQKKESNYEAGISFLKNFWINKGLNEKSINFADGSGLSPQNYVSAKAEVQALLYAQKQPWFPIFYDGFPTHENGMKMKSGSLKNTKSYAGIYKNYTFSIIINNYQAQNGGEVLQKILNELK
ncbi:MAG: D-alanyl-D-alanine carboxypeptidase/D-alanyl-D-alanine-endopeptidase [Bacteroidetes bacterium]|jgi:D-alanyl-D-alanine carboxypeptidase/D-alanyl-D-alanine-endopeptidase (penicillin-binding protein 4)|nr:D-alanyl-D-alanine carboxypeptidase/D-alanyl-D-alanine-endopeptidase [Bacteroidota bacterium]